MIRALAYEHGFRTSYFSSKEESFQEGLIKV